MALLKSRGVGSVDTSQLRTLAVGLGCTATKIYKGFLDDASTFIQRGEELVLLFSRAFLSGRCRGSGKDVLDHTSVDIRQAEIASLVAVRQLTVVNPKLV